MRFPLPTLIRNERFQLKPGYAHLRTEFHRRVRVVASLADFAGNRPQPPGGRIAIPAAFRYPEAVSLRTPVVCSIRRSDHPSGPNATTCSRFSALKTLLMPTEPTPSLSMSRALSLAGLQVTAIGQFWVTAAVIRSPRSDGGSGPALKSTVATGPPGAIQRSSFLIDTLTLFRELTKAGLESTIADAIATGIQQAADQKFRPDQAAVACFNCRSLV